MADMNSKPVSSLCNLRAQLARTDLAVEMCAYSYVSLRGTLAQLLHEGIPGMPSKGPKKGRRVDWSDATSDYVMWVEGRHVVRKLYGEPQEEEILLLRIYPRNRLSGFETEMLQKMDEIHELRKRATRDHDAAFARWLAASRDEQFQSRMNQILSPAQPGKGGRARKVHSA